MDKNGNFRFTFNFYAQLLVDSTAGRKIWKPARDIYMGFTLKGKIMIKESGRKKVLVMMPKSAEASMVKILKEDGEEMVVEQMVLMSAINVQAENMLKLIEPFNFPLKNPKTPKEMECLGFGLSEVFVEFRKGYLELGCTYKNVPQTLNRKVCQTFIDALRNGPKDLLSKGEEILADPQSFGKKLKEDFEKISNLDPLSHMGRDAEEHEDPSNFASFQ